MTNEIFTELARCLQKQGIDSKIQKDRRLEVFFHGQPALFVSPKNEVFLLPEMSGNDETGDLYHEVAQISDEVFSYVGLTEQWEKARKPLKILGKTGVMR